MASGDGLIVRVRAGVRPLTASTLHALAALARTHGSGHLELTRRANLQLRGVAAEALSPLQQALVALGVADASARRERRLALLLADPLAGLDPACAQVEPVRAALEHALADASLPDALPAKLAVVVSGGSGALAALPADVRVVLHAEEGEIAYLQVGVDRSGDASFTGVCALRDVAPAVARLLETFTRERDEAQRSMRAFVAARGTSRLEDAVRPWVRAATVPARAPVDVPRSIGFSARLPDLLGVALPFGAAHADAWDEVANLAARFGDGSIRTTPSRVLLLPGIGTARRDEVRALAARAGLVIDSDDPLLSVVACPGAPSCGSAAGETRSLARSLVALLAPRLRNGETLHVSGCAKGCAQSGPASLTLVHGHDGLRLGRDVDVAATAAGPALSRETALAHLAASARDDKVAAPMTRRYDYERDAAAIYRRSFAIIRAEAKLDRFAPIDERVAVRLIHTSGMVELADDIVFTPGFGEAAAGALKRGAPILCDVKMVASGVTRARLPASNEVVCVIDDPAVPALAAAQQTTRTAAAITLWGDKLDGAVVAIGNAPTALFRLLELLDETKARPAAIIGLPVGFVGAAESKEALIEDGRVPAMIVRGRKGGSAMTAAALNALASEKE